MVKLKKAIVFIAAPVLGWSFNVQAEDLLGDDDFSFDSGVAIEAEKSWLDDSRFTLQQTAAQGKSLQLLRSEFRFEYESAPWEGAYIKIDNRLSYFWHKDRQADQQDTDYGHNKLNEAWFQLSHQDCFGKIGRQVLLWGSVEGTFAVDVVSPFDYTEPLLTDFTSIRLAQDMASVECFFDQQQLQVFFQPRAQLDVFEHRQEGALEDLEDRLNEEWGIRYIKSWEGLDVHMMYARLYSNTPVTVLSPAPAVDASRHDFAGVTVVKAIRRLLIELDLGYRTDQVTAFTGKLNDTVDIALGFEYTTASNHQINAGVWRFEAQPLSLLEDLEWVEALTLGWSKTYLNDDLTMSLLGSYFSEPEQSSMTLQSQFKVDDYWTLSAALGYADVAQTLGTTEPGWSLNTSAKWQY